MNTTGKCMVCAKECILAQKSVNKDWGLCQQLYLRNYVALVAAVPDNSTVANNHSNVNEVQRTGVVMHIPRSLQESIFDNPARDESGCPLPLVFVEPQVIEDIRYEIRDVTAEEREKLGIIEHPQI